MSPALPLPPTDPSLISTLLLTLLHFVKRETATPPAPRTHTEGPARPVGNGNPAISSARVPLGARTRELASLHRVILGPGNKGGRGCGGEKGGGD